MSTSWLAKRVPQQRGLKVYFIFNWEISGSFLAKRVPQQRGLKEKNISYFRHLTTNLQKEFLSNED